MPAHSVQQRAEPIDEHRLQSWRLEYSAHDTQRGGPLPIEASADVFTDAPKELIHEILAIL
jgi:hypothetical protein